MSEQRCMNGRGNLLVLIMRHLFLFLFFLTLCLWYNLPNRAHRPKTQKGVAVSLLPCCLSLPLPSAFHAPPLLIPLSLLLPKLLFPLLSSLVPGRHGDSAFPSASDQNHNQTCRPLKHTHTHTHTHTHRGALRVSVAVPEA